MCCGQLPARPLGRPPPCMAHGKGALAPSLCLPPPHPPRRRGRYCPGGVGHTLSLRSPVGRFRSHWLSPLLSPNLKLIRWLCFLAAAGGGALRPYLRPLGLQGGAGPCATAWEESPDPERPQRCPARPPPFPPQDCNRDCNSSASCNVGPIAILWSLAGFNNWNYNR